MKEPLTLNTISHPLSKKAFSTVLVIVILSLLSCHSEEQTNTKSRSSSSFSELHAELDSIHRSSQIIGAAVAISDTSGTLFSTGYGMADHRMARSYRQHTVQPIASVSKTMIGIALLQLQEMGKLNLDDPIENHLPFAVRLPMFPLDTIRIRHLACHTSGIQDSHHYMEQAWVRTKYQPHENLDTAYYAQRLNHPKKLMPLEDFLHEYLSPTGQFYDQKNFTEQRVGMRYHYSNIGASLAALVVEHASGISYDQFTQKYILKPLGMNDSGWKLKDVKLENHSILYRNDLSPSPSIRLLLIRMACSLPLLMIWEYT